MAAIPSSAVVGDPVQPDLLLLPKSRSLDNMPPAGTSGKQKVSPLIGLFGPSMRPEVLQKIKVFDQAALAFASSDSRSLVLTNSFCAISAGEMVHG